MATIDELRYDRYQDVWIYDGQVWEKLTDKEGNQITLAEARRIGLAPLWPFKSDTDPTRFHLNKTED